MIGDLIGEWIKGILIDGIMGNLSGLFNTVNTKVGEIASDVGSTPQDWNGGIFSMLQNLSETVIVPIAAAILALVMCYELIDMIVEKNNMHDFDSSMFFRWIFKSAFAILIVTNTWNIVMGVFDATQQVVNQSAGVIIGDTSIDFDTLLPDLESRLEAMDIGPLLGLWFQTLVVGLTMNILSICIFLVTYDVQISSRYNDVYDEEYLPGDDYEVVTDYLAEHGIETDYDCTFSLYLPKKDDFHNRMKYDFPIAAISLSDYNTIRAMLGYGPVSLSENEFTTQWQTIATEEERNSFLAEHTSVMTDAGELTLSEQSYYEEAIGETAYNSYTDVLYIFPDSVCEKLLPVMRNRYITTSENISYENARELEQVFSDEYPEITDTGVRYTIRLSTLQINSTKANNFVMQASMLYGAVVLMVICLTILSLQQLLDAGKYKYRFSVLRKLGVEEQQIGKLVLKQLGVWFGLPILVAIIVSMIVIAYFIQTVSAEISAYIGSRALMLQIGMIVGILVLLLICYFISTWILFKRSISK